MTMHLVNACENVVVFMKGTFPFSAGISNPLLMSQHMVLTWKSILESCYHPSEKKCFVSTKITCHLKKGEKKNPNAAGKTKR